MKAAGGQMEVMIPVKFIDTDVLISVPIAKTHNLSRLTLGGKNLLRVI